MGLGGHAVIRVNPRDEERVWANMPTVLRKYESLEPNRKVVMIVASKSYGDNVEDCIVVTRLGTTVPWWKALVDSDRERYAHGTSPSTG